jgi:hypothetical protein
MEQPMTPEQQQKDLDKVEQGQRKEFLEMMSVIADKPGSVPALANLGKLPAFTPFLSYCSIIRQERIAKIMQQESKCIKQLTLALVGLTLALLVFTIALYYHDSVGSSHAQLQPTPASKIAAP